MLKRSTLLNYQNGNISDLTRTELIKLVRYYESVVFTGFEKAEDYIKEDVEED